MTFLRTEEGLTNQALFRDVDIVIYTEGGENSYSIEDILKGDFNEWSIDQVFWDGILQKHKFEQKYKLLPIGSKTTLEHIANMIVNEKVENVGVAMDTDLDDINGTKKISPYILYTYGYSWESDVFEFSVLEHFVIDYLPKHIRRSNIIDYAQKKLDNYLSGCTKITAFNLLYIKTNAKRLHYKDFKFQSKSEIGLDIVKIDDFILKEKTGVKASRSLNRCNSRDQRIRRYINGKWVKIIYKDVLNHVRIERLRFKNKLPMDHLEREFVNRYMKLKNVESFLFHERQIKQLRDSKP